VNSRRSAFIYAGLSIASLSCIAFLLLCPHRSDCLRSLTQAATWLTYGGQVVQPLLIVSMLAWLIRLSWILAATLAWRRSLVPVATPAAIEAAAERIGVRRVVTVRGVQPEALCAGAARPEVIITEAVAEALDQPEIEAVLIHEHEHARRREPLLRAGLQAAAEVFFYIPIIRWLAQRRLEESELSADRTALDRLGARPLAGALWVLGNGAVLRGVAAFGDAADLRVAQVLGEPIPRHRLAGSTLAVSAIGALLALQSGSCLAQAIAHL